MDLLIWLEYLVSVPLIYTYLFCAHYNKRKSFYKSATINHAAAVYEFEISIMLITSTKCVEDHLHSY